MVFQHFMLADNFTVWENIVLGQEPGTNVLAQAGPRRRRGSANSASSTASSVDPDALVCDLGVGDKQRVEILKVLYRGAHILILDEPTAVLVPQEVDELFRSLRELTTTGHHRHLHLPQARRGTLKHADAITVIRQGKTVGEIDDPSTVTSRDLAEMMVGSELPTPETRGENGHRHPRPRASTTSSSDDDEQRERLLVDHVSFTDPPRARSSASPASRATVRANSSGR